MDNRIRTVRGAGGHGIGRKGAPAEPLRATQGNLSVHLRKLEEAGYIQTERRLKGKKTETKAWLTPAGHRAFGRYLKAMEALIRTSEG